MSTNRSPLKAIRAKCMSCSGDSFKEVRECHLVSCPLWPFRSGHRLPKEIVEGGARDQKSAPTVGVNDITGDSGEEEAD